MQVYVNARNENVEFPFLPMEWKDVYEWLISYRDKDNVFNINEKDLTQIINWLPGLRKISVNSASNNSYIEVTFYDDKTAIKFNRVGTEDEMFSDIAERHYVRGTIEEEKYNDIMKKKD